MIETIAPYIGLAMLGFLIVFFWIGLETSKKSKRANFKKRGVGK